MFHARGHAMPISLEMPPEKKARQWGRRAVEATEDPETKRSRKLELDAARRRERDAAGGEEMDGAGGEEMDGAGGEEMDAAGGEEMDAARWGELQYHIDLELVVAQLPLHAFYKFRAVCKKWRGLPWNRRFLEQHSTTSLPKPYFVFHGSQGCHQALLLKDTALQKWALKPLPTFAFDLSNTSVANGLVHTEAFDRDGVTLRCFVFNLHTKVFRRLPPLTIVPRHTLSKLSVDSHSASYKVLVVAAMGRVWVYDSVTGVWTQRAAAPKNFVCCDVYASSCDGVMYFKWGRGSFDGPGIPLKMFAYNFKEDVWTMVPVAPFVPPVVPFVRPVVPFVRPVVPFVRPVVPFVLPSARRKWRAKSVECLGEWRGALRDVSLDAAGTVLCVWEFEQNSQEWLEVDRMPGSKLKWLLGPRTLRFSSHESNITASYCEQYVLLWNREFPGMSGLVRAVMYDMALRVWETLTVEKNWTCPVKN